MKYKIKPMDPKKAQPVKTGQAPPVHQTVQKTKRNDSIIRKCIGIIIDDINWKFRGIKSEEQIEMERKLEIYESFYKLAKEGK